MRGDLIKIRGAQPTTGKVDPELKFVFWQKMFTGRVDTRICNTHLRTVLPNMDPAPTVQQLRKLIHDELDQLRALRNRIAHHEPTFTRNPAIDFVRAQDLIGFRCMHTAAWMATNQQAVALMEGRPS